MAKLSVIIVEFFSLDDIRKCIKSYKENIPDIEIVVSSNSQYDLSRQKEILEAFPDCVWCFNDRNGGFAYAMNKGLAVASGDYLIISNPDCTVKYGIREMANFMKRFPEIGAIAPKIVDSDGKIQDSCRSYVTLPGFILRQIRRIIFKEESIISKRTDYDKIQTVDWVIGAFIMTSRTVYEQTGGLSHDYFMYAEDVDWCTRIRQKGYEIVYYPKAEIIYKGSRNARKSMKYARIFIKSHIIYWHKFGFFFIKPKRKIIDFENKL